MARKMLPLISFVACLAALGEAATYPKKDIACITIPKSGTHLLYKCLKLLDSKNIQHPHKNGLSLGDIAKIRQLNKRQPPYHYKGFFHIPTVGPLPNGMIRRMQASTETHTFWNHWPYTPQCEAAFNKYTYANFFMIRDLCDQLVSMAFMIYKNHDGKTVPLKKVILDLIDGRQQAYVPWGVEIQAAYPLRWELGVVRFYRAYLPWMKASKFHTVIFENLVGPHGGGSKTAQVREIQRIAHHLGLEPTPYKIESVIKKLFGGTLTFREGKIGSWKKYFTPEIKKAFKGTRGACRLLIELGYEKDANW